MLNYTHRYHSRPLQRSLPCAFRLYCIYHDSRGHRQHTYAAPRPDDDHRLGRDVRGFNETLARVAEFVGLPAFKLKCDSTHQRKGECREGDAGYGPEFFTAGGRRVRYCPQGIAVGDLAGGLLLLLPVSLLFQE